MRIKAGDKWFECTPDSPIMVELTPADKANIEAMPEQATKYACFSDAAPRTREERFAWMNDPPAPSSGKVPDMMWGCEVGSPEWYAIVERTEWATVGAIAKDAQSYLVGFGFRYSALDVVISLCEARAKNGWRSFVAIGAVPASSAEGGTPPEPGADAQPEPASPYAADMSDPAKALYWKRAMASSPPEPAADDMVERLTKLAAALKKLALSKYSAPMIEAAARIAELQAEVERLKASPSPALADVISERARQCNEEGWTPEHDDQHDDGSLALAAACYAEGPGARIRVEIVTDDVSGGRGDTPVWGKRKVLVPIMWPRSWSAKWWKPKDRRRDLVRAGALIVAEIERLDRASLNVGKSDAG